MQSINIVQVPSQQHNLSKQSSRRSRESNHYGSVSTINQQGPDTAREGSPKQSTKQVPSLKGKKAKPFISPMKDNQAVKVVIRKIARSREPVKHTASSTRGISDADEEDEDPYKVPPGAEGSNVSPYEH